MLLVGFKTNRTQSRVKESVDTTCPIRAPLSFPVLVIFSLTWLFWHFKDLQDIILLLSLNQPEYQRYLLRNPMEICYNFCLAQSRWLAYSLARHISEVINSTTSDTCWMRFLTKSVTLWEKPVLYSLESQADFVVINHTSSSTITDVSWFHLIAMWLQGFSPGTLVSSLIKKWLIPTRVLDILCLTEPIFIEVCVTEVVITLKCGKVIIIHF